ncbi:hypothetical protein PVAP13_6NG200403 [Panicum virgatum]|uniref:Uncharacterized protein n=1 Tax=Panicum virgatum TaxID=38727 RepID=A0A8T0QZM9_PANVG|nr:hypothetical protein PVAP13_6NG200403 [Panicum virgatum]
MTHYLLKLACSCSDSSLVRASAFLYTQQCGHLKEGPKEYFLLPAAADIFENIFLSPCDNFC